MKRVLIVAFYFPPIQNGGVRRPMAWVKYLPAFGWQPTVLTITSDSLKGAVINSELLDEIDSAVPILRAWYPDLSKLPICRGFLGKHLYRPLTEQWLIPGPERLWNTFALHKAKALLKARQVDAVLTTSPPPAVNLIGQAIQSNFGIPWIMDMRDEWTTNPYLHEKYAKFSEAQLKKEKAMEQTCFRNAARIITISERIRANFSKLAADKGKITVIPNGYDIQKITVSIKTAQPCLYMVYGGSLYQRNIHKFLQALQELKQEGKIQENTIRIEIYTDSDVRAYLKTFASLVNRGEVAFFKILKQSQFLEKIAACHVALVFSNYTRGAETVMTGKLFELMGLRKMVFAMVPPDGDAAAIVKKSGLGPVVALEDYEGIKKNLYEIYKQWNTGNIGVTPNETFIQTFDRKQQVAYLSQILNETVVHYREKTKAR